MTKPLAVLEAENEESRLAKRGDIRRQIAEGSLLRERIAALNGELHRLDSVVLEAANAHSEICGPLQAELTALEAEAVRKIQSREEPDAAADARRAEILAEIERQNSILQTVRDTQDRLKGPVIQEKLKHELAAGRLPTREFLGGDGVGNPKLTAERFAHQSFLEWLHLLKKDIQPKIDAAAEFDLQAGSNRAAKWRACLALVEQNISTAKTRLSEIQTQLLAE